MVRRLPLALALALALAQLLPAAVTASSPRPPPTAHEVMAAFLYNFGKFVTWPSDATDAKADFPIAVLGSEPFGDVLEATLRGKLIDGRKVVVRRVTRPQEVGSSRILFIGDSESDRLAAILDAVSGKAILTVSQIERFAERGGMMRFRLEQERVRFDISIGAAQRARLRISSELLKLARIVEPRAGG